MEEETGTSNQMGPVENGEEEKMEEQVWMGQSDVAFHFSGNSEMNLKALKIRQELEKKFRNERSNVVTRAQLAVDRKRFKTWRAGNQETLNIEARVRLEEFRQRIAAVPVQAIVDEPLELDIVKMDWMTGLARTNQIKKARTAAAQEQKDREDAGRCPWSRMDEFFAKAPNMHASVLADSVGCQPDFENIPNGADSVLDELFKREHKKDAVIQDSEEVADINVGEVDPYTQRASVFERKWVQVCEYDEVWQLCCSTLVELRKDARAHHRPLSACRSCATIFTTSFPAEHHMHEVSAVFKTCMDGRLTKVASDQFPYRALVALSKEARAYKKEGTVEFIKMMRIVNGVRLNSGSAKYAQLEICENNNVEDHESTSRKIFESRNLAVGILKLIEKIRFTAPIPTALVNSNQHGAGLANYFNYYRNLVVEFESDLVFRGFLVEFGQHVRQALKFDQGLNSRWWIGPFEGMNKFFDSTKWCLISLDGAGMIELALNLARGTLKVLDDFFTFHTHDTFLTSAIDQADLVLEHLGFVQSTELKDAVEDVVVKREAIVLTPFAVLLDPEVRDVQKRKKTSEKMLAKRLPDLTTDEIIQRDRKRANQAAYAARKKAEKEAARLIGK